MTSTNVGPVDTRRARHMARIEAVTSPRQKLAKAFDYLRSVVDDEPDTVLLPLVDHLVDLGDRKGVVS